MRVRGDGVREDDRDVLLGMERFMKLGTRMIVVDLE